MQVQGFQTFLLISAFDSEGPVYPPDLLGKSIDDPQLIHRFKALMDWVIHCWLRKGLFDRDFQRSRQLVR
jgi:hypothetical protein